ncbi:MAG: oxidoreductase, partial [Micrococcales bacterium]|nr:oxidoreductase [Micrococcales bacterium]
MSTAPQSAAARRPHRAWYALGALLGAAAGAGLGHLVAGLVSPEASPVLAVGSTVIDATPTPVKEWAVSTFGTNDKPILIGSVTVVTLLLAAAAGLLARSRRTLGLAALGVLAMLAVAAAALRPTASPVDLFPGLVTALVGVLAAGWFLGTLDRWGAAAADPAAGAGPDRTARGDGTSGRRSVLLGAAGLGV